MLISEISATDILDLIRAGVPEDQFIEYKAELLDPRKPKDRLDADRADWVADLVAFANAQGGHIIIGMEGDQQERAARLRPMTGDDAKKLADSLRDLAIAHIKPNLVQLEFRSFEITAAEWIVVVGVPNSTDKPHLSSFYGGTRFAVRDGNRKREMTHEEIRKLFLNEPQQERLLQVALQLEAIRSQVESINSRISGLENEVRKAR